MAMAAVATPAPAPTTSIVSPGWSRALVTIIRQAVRKVRGKAAASSQESAAGFGYTFWAGTCTSSQAVPSVCSPRMPKSGHATCWPARQASQRQQQETG